MGVGIQEKTKKILDIWTKSNTFPANVLTRLSGQVRTAENPKGAYCVSLLYVAKYLPGNSIHLPALQEKCSCD